MSQVIGNGFLAKKAPQKLVAKAAEMAGFSFVGLDLIQQRIDQAGELRPQRGGAGAACAMLAKDMLL